MHMTGQLAVAKFEFSAHSFTCPVLVKLVLNLYVRSRGREERGARGASGRKGEGSNGGGLLLFIVSHSIPSSLH